ncbi:hypothetical protein [Bosea sp. (in: a-proteobacteria)]|jgi:hypothetical protein|uniref:Flp pilus assembly pilin Flp n=1 Tax=Bosea vestrisii TaxID=151416 RepID=A0ABW0H8B7_9HYPH|nr:hypothetical protein [Bosea sp. (in: a-proteobacteria)]MBA4219283.1 hypothetical protein [Methylobacterium sp.]MBR3193720.1 hypothetical protein [Bosea sp. (in: a-proteobacteria)]
MRSIVLFWKNARGSMVADVAKAAAAIAFLSVIAVNFVSSHTAQLDRDAMRQVAQAAAKGQTIDPLVTGSIVKRANETKLDPCVVPR